MIPLKLVALDQEDISIISAHVQDSVLKIANIIWLKSQRQFLIEINRYAWEKETVDKSIAKHERRLSLLMFDNVMVVSYYGFDTFARDGVLELLAIEFQQDDEPPSGDILLSFAGGGTIKLKVECIEVHLRDLGAAWSTDAMPVHNIGEN